MSRHGSVGRRRAPLSMVLIGACALVVALAITRSGPAGSATRVPTEPGAGTGAGAGASNGLVIGASLRPSASAAGPGRALPQGLAESADSDQVEMKRSLS